MLSLARLASGVFLNVYKHTLWNQYGLPYLLYWRWLGNSVGIICSFNIITFPYFACCLCSMNDHNIFFSPKKSGFFYLSDLLMDSFMLLFDHHPGCYGIADLCCLITCWDITLQAFANKHLKFTLCKCDRHQKWRHKCLCKRDVSTTSANSPKLSRRMK